MPISNTAIMRKVPLTEQEMNPQTLPGPVVIDQENPNMVPVDYITGAPQQQSQSVGEMQTTQKVMPPQFDTAMAQIENAGKAQKAAVAKMGEADAQIATVTADQFKAIADDLEQSNRDYLERKKALDAAISAKDNQINSAKSELAEAKIDGMRLFKQGNQNRVIAALGLAIGGFGAALTGGKNYAADMLNTIIENDINEQKFEYEKKSGALGTAMKEREIIDARFDRDEDRYLVQRNNRLEAIKNQAEGMLARIGGTKAKEQMALTIAGIDQQIAQNKATMYQNAASTVTTAQKFGPGEASPEQRKLVTNYGLAPDVTSAGKVRDADASTEYLKTEFEKARAAIKEYGLGGPLTTGKAAAALDKARITVIQAMQKAFDSGVLNPGEYETFIKEIPLNGWRSLFTSEEFALAKLDEIQSMAENKNKSIIQANISTPFGKGYTPASFNPSGGK
jgi:hypothetical protein